MKRIQWKLLVTRETTLLERYLRMAGYGKGFGRRSKIRVRNILTVSQESVSEQYVDTLESLQNEAVLEREYSRGQYKKLFKFFNQSLQALNKFVLAMRKLRRATQRSVVQKSWKKFLEYYYRSRAIIFYTHVADSLFTKTLQSVLKNQGLRASDEVLAILTRPAHHVHGLESLLTVSESARNKREHTMQQYKMNARARAIADYIAALSYYHEVGERLSSSSFDAARHILRLIAREVHVAESDLYYYTPHEITMLFHGRSVASSIISERRHLFVLFLQNGRITLFEKKHAETIIERELPRVATQYMEELKGFSASSGKARGIVVMVRKVEDLMRIKKGNILVSPMTTPRMIAGIKRAAAIVTDEGGITCHAAIISREFKIPCIIGTKIATRVFKDGDQIEVDAIKGIVKKIKN